MNSIVSGLVQQDLPRSFEDVEIELLWYDAEKGLRPGEIVFDIDAKDPNRTGGLVDKRTNDPDGGRFASAVRSKQRKEITLSYTEINPAEGSDPVVVGFPEIEDFESRCHSKSEAAKEKLR